MIKYAGTAAESAVNFWRSAISSALAMFLVAGVVYVAAPAHSNELGVEVIQEAYLVDSDGNQISEVKDGAPAPHELRMSISIPENVKDGDKLTFITSTEHVVESGRDFSPIGLRLHEGSTSQIMSSADKTTVIADVNVITSYSFEIIFNGNADAERGNALYTNAYDVSVLIRSTKPTFSLNSWKEWTDDPSLDGKVAMTDKGHWTYYVEQVQAFSSVGEKFSLLEMEYELPRIYSYEELYLSSFLTNDGSMYGSGGTPQPTEMLTQWKATADFNLASSPEKGETYDIVFEVELPEGVEIREQGGDYAQFMIRPFEYLTEEEAKELALQNGQTTGRVEWGEHGKEIWGEEPQKLGERAFTTLSEDGRTLTVTIPDAPTKYAYRVITTFPRMYSEYRGETETKTWKLHVPESTTGKGHDGKLSTREINWELQLTSALAASGGLADPTQVRRAVDMTVNAEEGLKNGEETQITPGKVTYTVKLKNNSNVTVRLNSIILPDGTSKELNELRLRAGSTEEFKFELDEPAFAGVQQRIFKAEIALMDDVTGSISISVASPNYPAESIDAPQTVTTSIPAPSGVADSLTFRPAATTPSWAKINPDGSLSITPPKNTPAGEHPIDVLVTYPDGSTETITVKVNITEVPVAAVDPMIVISGETAPDPTSFVSNIRDLPEGTKVAWKDNPPATNVLGQSEHTAVVMYPDGSTSEIIVPISVVMNQAQYDELMNQRENARNNVNNLENRLNTGLGRCVGTVGGSLLALIPAVLIASQFIGSLHIELLDNYLAEVQKRLGIFNPDLAQLVNENRGAIAGGFGALGILAILLAPSTCRGASLGKSITEPLSSK